MICFLAARSVKEIADVISFSFLLFLANLRLTSRLDTTFLFIFPLRIDPLRALLAVLVTGIHLIINYQLAIFN